MKNSIQVWKVSNVEVFRLSPNSREKAYHQNMNYNLLVENVTLGDSPSQTTYVSHMWFRSSIINDNTSVTCGGRNDAKSIQVVDRGK